MRRFTRRGVASEPRRTLQPVADRAFVEPTWPFFKILWVGRAGLGFVWRGIEHQLYRNLDGSMGRFLTHQAFPYTDEAWLRWDDVTQKRIKV
jgi:hypothetical protein